MQMDPLAMMPNRKRRDIVFVAESKASHLMT